LLLTPAATFRGRALVSLLELNCWREQLILHAHSWMSPQVRW